MTKVSVSLKFPNQPFVKEPPLEVWLQGRDSETGDNVDFRVAATTLTRHFGAKGIAGPKLICAFEAHRDEFEQTARRKYAAGEVERLGDRIVVRL